VSTVVTYAHSNSANCGSYHTTLVEVSADGGTTWYSNNYVYTDLLANMNTDFNLVLKPQTYRFDSGTTDYTRKIRISVKSTYGSQAVQQYTYNVTIKPKSALATLADT